MHIPIESNLVNSNKILICGAGGGYDIYSGIPLFLKLRSLGKEIVLANYSFTALTISKGEAIGETGYLVTKTGANLEYFPEKHLAHWLDSIGENPPIIAFEKSGVQPLVKTIKTVKEIYGIDTVILVDGGTDSLMRGNETGLGTPTEDATTIAAFNLVEFETKILTCVGFGIDHFHGVSHYQFLENVAELTEKNAFLGVNSLTKLEEEGKHFLSLINYANQNSSNFPSIVANSIASSILGKFGDYHATHRTNSSELFINPLMSFHWYFDLTTVANGIYYLKDIENTNTEKEVMKNIVNFRMSIKPKPFKRIPL